MVTAEEILNRLNDEQKEAVKNYVGPSFIVAGPGAGKTFTVISRTQYMILNSDGQEWEYRFISLDYDVERVIKEIHESGLWDIAPYWCRITEHLLYTGEISHGTVLNEAMRLNGYKDNWYNIEEKYWDEALRIFEKKNGNESE